MHTILQGSNVRENKGGLSKEDVIKPRDQAYLQWSDVSYYVPQKTNSCFWPDKIVSSLDKRRGGLPPVSIKSFPDTGQKKFKQIVHYSSGYVAPNEMVAILGPSGSGKTSLLNVLS